MSQLGQQSPTPRATPITQDESIKQIEAGVLSESSSLSALTQDALNVEKIGKADEDENANPNANALEKQETHFSIHHPSAFPDGGLKAWLCVFGAFCSFFCSFGWVNAIGIFQGYYQENQLSAYSPSTVSWISSLQVFWMFGSGTIVGKFFDAYGPRYILLIGSFLHVFGLMMVSISYKYWHFVLSQGIVSALGAGMIFYPAMTSVATWFFHRRAFALGITASGSSLGGVIFPIMLRRLIVEIGFGWAMRCTAFLILFLMIFANLTLRSRLPPKGPTPWNLGEFTRHFKEPRYALVVAAAFFFFFGMFLPINYLTVYGIRQGMSGDLSSYLIAIFNATSIFGRILPGYIGDKVGRFNTMVVISYGSAILVLALWIPGTGNLPIIIFACLYGFTTGAFVSLAPALVAQISDIREIGLRNGSLFAVVSIAGLTGSPIGGALLDRYGGGFLGMQIFAGVMLMAGSTVFLIARVVQGGVGLKVIL